MVLQNIKLPFLLNSTREQVLIFALRDTFGSIIAYFLDFMVDKVDITATTFTEKLLRCLYVLFLYLFL